LGEGDTPFATARLGGHDDVCELLAPLMKDAQKPTQEFGYGPESRNFDVK
jgi:hypothetical protein